MVEMATPPEVKPKLSRLSRDGSGGVDPLDTSDLEVAAQSITLMSPGTNCIKIGLPGKLILSKRKGLREVLFS